MILFIRGYGNLEFKKMNKLNNKHVYYRCNKRH